MGSIKIKIWCMVCLYLVFSGFLYAQTEREPVFAGLFYPKDKVVLEKMVSKYLAEAEKEQNRLNKHIFGIISPHAGYEYSGKVAAFSFNQIKGRQYKTVVIIGSSHQVPFRGISIYPDGFWRTPLGIVEIDKGFVKELMKECPQIKTYPAPFQNEHSLEVQLPFLQSVLKNFKIVPLVTGGMDKKEYDCYVDALVKLIRKHPKELLIVASTDMSHFHDYSTAKSIDTKTLKHIENLDEDALIEDLDKGKCELCGPHGTVILIKIAKRLNASVQVLKYANSGDVTGDKKRVVGYGAAAFYYNEANPHKNELNRDEQKILLNIARKTLEEYVIHETIPRFEIKDKKLLEKRGVFVTLKKKGELRGCIGYIEPVLPLYKAVVDMTVAASSKDMRFLPVHKGELKDIKIEISILTPLKPIKNFEEIEVGKHGLFIKKGSYSGLLLPQVPVEYGWDREEFLRQTCIKAGLYKNAWKDENTEIYIFSAQIISE